MATKKDKAISLGAAAILTVSTLTPNFALATSVEDSNKPKLSVNVKNPDSFLDEKWGEASWLINVSDDKALSKVIIKSNNNILFEKNYTETKIDDVIEYHMTKDDYEKSQITKDGITLTFIVIDNEGNEFVQKQTYKVDIAVTNPTITGLNKEYFNVIPNITIKNEDINKKDLTVEIKKGEESIYKKTVNADESIILTDNDFNNNDGEYNVKIILTDTVGNKKELNKIVVRDSQAATVSLFNITGQKNNQWYVRDILINAKLHDNYGDIKYQLIDVKAQKLLKSGEITKTEGNITCEFNELTEGEQEIKLIVTDKNDNVVEETKKFYADTHIPEVKIEGLSKKIYKKIPNFIVKADDKKEGSSLKNGTMLVKDSRIKIDVLKDNNYFNSLEFEGIDTKEITQEMLNITEDGSYNLKVTAVDGAGNISKEYNKLVALDNNAPTISDYKIQGNISANGWYNSDVNVSFKVSDVNNISKVIVKLNNTELMNKDINKTSENISLVIPKSKLKELKVGNKYALEMIVEDELGNQRNNIEKFNVDLEKPEVSIIGPKENSYNKEVKNVKIKVNDESATLKGSKIDVTVIKDGKENNYTKQQVEEFFLDNEIFNETGRYEIKAVATDCANNVSEIKTLSFIVDKENPIINNINLSGNLSSYGWFNSNVDLSFNVTDNYEVNNIKVMLNDNEIYSNFATKKVSITMTKEELEKINKNGNYTLKLIAEDKAGNETVEVKKFNADFIAPNLEIKGPKEGSYNQEVKDVTIITDDIHALLDGSKIKVQVTKNGKITEYISEKSNIFKLNNEIFSENGVYELKVIAIDCANNVSKEETLSFIVDKENPVIENIKLDGQLSEYNWFNSNINLSFDIRDNFIIDDIKIMVNDKELYSKSLSKSNSKISYEITSKVLEEISKNGNYEIKLVAKDKAGNEIVEIKKFNADFIKPEVTITGVKNNSNNKIVKDVICNVTDIHSTEKGSKIYVNILKDGKETKIQNESINSLKLDNKLFEDSGIYTISAYAIDCANNKSKEEVINFVVDNKAPEILDIKNEGNISTKKWYNSAIKTTFTAKDNIKNISEVSLKVNEKTYIDKEYVGNEKLKEKVFSYTLSKEELTKIVDENGKVHYEFRVKDKAGNETIKKQTLKVDFVAPVLEMRGIQKGKHYNSIPVINITSNEKFYKDGEINVRIVRDKKEVINKTFKGVNDVTLKSSYFEKDGKYQIIVKSKDGANNESKEIKTNFVIDKTKTNLTIGGVKENSYNNQAVTINFKAIERFYQNTDVKIHVERTLKERSYKNTYDFKLYKDVSKKSLTFKETGTYKIYMTSKDEAGNESKSKSLTFTVDAVKPIIKATLPKGILGYKDIVAPKVEVVDDYIRNVEVAIYKNGQRVNMKNSSGKNIISFSDFRKIKANDGRYEVRILATDMAGNTSEAKGKFIVNRFGSKYSVSGFNKDKKWYNNFEKDIIIKAKNPSKLVEKELNVKLDGEIIKAGSIKERGSEGNYITDFVISNEDLLKEGIYKINAVTKDAKGNVVNSADEIGEIEFAVDRTEPTIVTDIEEERYKEKNHQFNIDVKDNMALDNVRVMIDGKKVKEVKGKKLNNNEANVTFEVKSGDNQEIEIIAEDKAGNKNEIKKTITINDSVFAFDGKLLAILGTATAILLAIIFYTKRKK